MTDYRPETFADAVGEDFVLEGSMPAVALTLDRIVPLPVSTRDGGGFVLEFSGDASVDVPQGSYALAYRGDSHVMFIVPVARQSDRIQLEAVFN